MPESARPLSPFLHYRWQYTNTLSLLHRATGVTLSGGLLLLVYWITAIARGPAAYVRAALLLSHPVFRVLFAFGLLAFVYHFCNGIRHLCWDVGLGLERREARRSAWIVVGATILIAGVGCVVLFGTGAAS